MRIMDILALAARNKEMQVRAKNAKKVGIIGFKFLSKTVLRNGVVIPKYSGGITTLTREPGQPIRRHRQKIYPSDPSYIGSLWECPDVKVTCDCEDHKFMWEFSLARRGVSDIYSSDGSPPIVKNPRMSFGICKHVLIALGFILKKRI